MLKRFLSINVIMIIMTTGCMDPQSMQQDQEDTGTEHSSFTDQLELNHSESRFDVYDEKRKDQREEGKPHRNNERNGFALLQEEVDNGNTSYPVNVTLNEVSVEEIQSIKRDEHVYLPLVDVFDVMGYEVINREKTVVAGYTDIIYEVQKDANQAEVEENEVTLPEQVITYQDSPYITVNSLQSLFGEEYDFTFEEDTLRIITLGEEEFEFPGDEDFADVLENEEEDVPALSRSKANAILRTALRYRGRPYQFGASTGDTSRFDCSSLTQYAFSVNGVSIPRSARQQSRRGRYVSVSQLKRGDLVFFYWPGRYNSNRVVGHVGIYGGGGYMINATPSRGVHVVNAAKSSYWRRTYLGAKRIGS